MLYDDQFSVLALESSKRKILGSGTSKHGLVVALAGVRRSEDTIKTKKLTRYDDILKTGSLTSVVYANVLVTNNELEEWLQWWLNQEMDGEEVLDVWDIGTAAITHMSKGYNRWCLAQSMKLINKTQKAAEKKAKKGGDTGDTGDTGAGIEGDIERDSGGDIEQLEAPEEGTRDQILQIWLGMLQKHSSTKATQLAVYLKRHAWGFSCPFGEQSKSSEQLNDMLRGLKQDEDSLRKTWVEEAVCQYAAKYTNTGESPTDEEQVRMSIPVLFSLRLVLFFF